MFQAAVKALCLVPTGSLSGGMLLNLRHYSKKTPIKVRISEALSAAEIGEKVQIQGWVRSVRAQKEHLFVHVNDGSSLQPLQIVATSELNNPLLTFGSAVEITGILKKSPHEKQPVELEANQIRVVGECNPVVRNRSVMFTHFNTLLSLTLLFLPISYRISPLKSKRGTV
uniref:OB domain-containing protein n=1 Tax=Sphaeramia orbicularis TaxID=375764 RepID=A0A673APU4_9TELE